jgi:hypothetical protein
MAELGEEYIRRLLEDLANISSVLRSKPRRAIIYVAPRESYGELAAAVRAIESKRNMGDFIRGYVGKARDKGKAARRARMLYELASKMPPELRARIAETWIEEYSLLQGEKESIARLAGLEEVEVYRSDDPEAPDRGGKKSQALPFKPAIYLE